MGNSSDWRFMNILRFYTKNMLRNYDYVISLPSSEVVLIDPTDGDLLLTLLAESSLRATHVFITHEHFDHISGLDKLCMKFHPHIYVYEGIINKFEKYSGILHGVKEGDEVLGFRVWEIPGHIPGHIGFISDNAAFVGDTIFNRGVGNTRSGNSEILFETINRLKSDLNTNVKIYPEHDYWKSNLEFSLKYFENAPRIYESAKDKLVEYDSSGAIVHGDFPASTWQEELDYNPFLRTNDEQIQKIIEEHSGSTIKNDKDAFLELRSLRDSW